MKLVKIINGTYGHRPTGSAYVLPVAAGGQPISVTDEEAERLVNLGVAAYVEQGAVATALSEDAAGSTIGNSPSDGDGERGDSDPAEIAGHLDHDDLMSWKMEDLKKLAADMGLDTADLKKKAAIVDSICAIEVSVPADAIEDAPDLGVEDVVEE